MLSVDDLFRRNFQHARSVNYDLSKVHSVDVCEMIRTSANSLLLDEQMLSLTLRSTAAFHLDTAKVRIDNDEQREKHVVDYTLIITTIGKIKYSSRQMTRLESWYPSGSGKSTLFNKLSEARTKREEFEKRRKTEKSSDVSSLGGLSSSIGHNKRGPDVRKNEWCRHSVTNDVREYLLCS